MTNTETELTDAQWDDVEAVALALEALGDATPSRVARKARIDTRAAGVALRWLVAHREAHTSGNGGWTHYHPGRGRDY